MSSFIQSGKPAQKNLSAEEIFLLENEGKLLRVLHPAALERIKQCLTTSRQGIEPFIVENNGEIYFSFLHLNNDEQRQRSIRKIQQWQMGIDVDLSSLPRPLHQLLQPHRAFSQKFVRVLVLGAVAGTFAGVLAMALSIILVSFAELVLGASFDAFGEIQITAVSFVIFAVLGWMAATPIFWNRFDH